MSIAFVFVAGFPFTAHSADAQRQAAAAKRGAEVMPFNLNDSTHVFTKNGCDMPGLAELQSAKPGQIGIDYRDVSGGAERAFFFAVPRVF